MVKTDGRPTIAWADPPSEKSPGACSVAAASHDPRVTRVRIERQVVDSMTGDQLKAWFAQVSKRAEVVITSAR